jgi:thymidylate synthase
MSSLRQHGEIGFVYKTIHIRTKKYYIGSRKGDFRTDSEYLGSGTLFLKALRKHGPSSFTREILYEGIEYRTKEDEILKQYDAKNDIHSYNLKNEALGGSFSGEENGMFGKKLTLDHVNKISKNSNMKTETGRKHHSDLMSGKNNPMFGKTHSEFTKIKTLNTLKMKKENWGFLNAPKHHLAVFRKIYRDLLKYSTLCEPRGLKIKEIENYTFTIPPYVRFTNFASRKFKINYVKKEFLWYLNGDPKDHSIYEHASIWKDITNADGSIYSNYGQYIFGNQNQFDDVVKTLSEDKDSRRAAISILNVNHLKSVTKDIPCTYSISFRIRNNFLNMSVRMRSMDAIFGFSNDIPCFSFIHEMMFISLKEIYPELEYGKYHHCADSFHVYERHFEMLNSLAKKDAFSLVLCPKISGKKEVDYLRSDVFIKNINESNLDLIPEEFKFSKWLKTDYEKGQWNPYNNIKENK